MARNQLPSRKIDTLSPAPDPTTEIAASDYNAFLDHTAGWINVASYGTNAAALASASADAQTQGKGLLVSEHLTIANATISISVPLQFVGAGAFDIGTSGSISITGPFIAPQHQVFYKAGGQSDGAGITFAGKVSEILSEWYGAIGDDSTDCTTPLNAAAVACGTTRRLRLIDGIYRMTATAGNYALTVKCPIRGNGPNNSILKNVGAGSALKIDGAYYMRWQEFGVQGNSSSQHGIVTATDGTLGHEAAYCTFAHVDSFNHGLHGLIHRMAWGTSYHDCHFHDNGGIGVFLNSPVVGGNYDAGTANGVAFFGCKSRWNGGSLTSTTYADDKGGVKIVGAAGVHWFGGVIESNNAWGVIVAPPIGGQSTRNVWFRGVYMEYNPQFATVGGNFYLSGPWTDVGVEKCSFGYGAPPNELDGSGNPTSTRKGYGFLVTGGESVETEFQESGNSFVHVTPAWKANHAYGLSEVVRPSALNGFAYVCTTAGTTGGSEPTWKRIDGQTLTDGTVTWTVVSALYHPSSVSYHRPQDRVSPVFGDYQRANVATDTRLFTISNDGQWIIRGTIHFKRDSDDTGADFPFAVVNDTLGGRQVVVGDAVGGVSTLTPSLAFSGDDVVLSLPGFCWGYVTVGDGGIQAAPTSIDFNPDLFGYFMRRK